MKITETERLIIEEATEDDAFFFFRLLISQNWLRYIGDRGIKSESDAAQYISANLLKSYQNNGFGLYKIVLKEENKPLGICGFVKRPYLDHVDIGFALLPEYEGNGYAYEAAKRILQYGFTTLQFTVVFAITTNENNKSQALLQRLGFKEAGTIQPDLSKPALLLYSM